MPYLVFKLIDQSLLKKIILSLFGLSRLYLSRLTSFHITLFNLPTEHSSSYQPQMLLVSMLLLQFHRIIYLPRFISIETKQVMVYSSVACSQDSRVKTRLPQVYKKFCSIWYYLSYWYCLVLSPLNIIGWMVRIKQKHPNFLLKN